MPMQSSLVPCVQTGPAVELGEIIEFHSKFPIPFQASVTQMQVEMQSVELWQASADAHMMVSCYTNAKINGRIDDWLHALLHMLRNDIHMKTVSSY